MASLHAPFCADNPPDMRNIGSSAQAFNIPVQHQSTNNPHRPRPEAQQDRLTHFQFSTGLSR